MIEIENVCALERIKRLPDNSQDIIFGDPPYALGSTVYVDVDGKPKYKQARDFMNKWGMPDHIFWEEFFVESMRVLKYGGRVLFFGIDRQLMLFQYYACAAGLETKQSLYWYFISNFPKATDLSKQVDRRLGVDSDLGQKYEGYKYSISPLKQVLETIMVFQKPTKNKSVLDDVLDYENGDDTISTSIWDIDRGRVPLEKTADKRLGGKGTWGTEKAGGEHTFSENGWAGDIVSSSEKGRFPSQLFVDENAGDILGESSRILHHIDYLDDENDLLIYEPKVSGRERNYGLGDEFENKSSANLPMRSSGEESVSVANDGTKTTRTTTSKNTHPTLKPIKLICNIAVLLKTPNPQNIFFPFVGSGSEIIGFMKAGFDSELFVSCELNDEYVKIADARIKYWENVDINRYIEKKEIVEVQEKPPTDVMSHFFNTE